MISVLTLTYKRHHILEEALQSFLLQKVDHPKEMIILNDAKDIDYVFDHPEVRIINHKQRFPSISAKLKFGFEQCKYDNMYRLDDDDLLSETGLATACEDILENPGYDIYRSKGIYFFVNNVNHGMTSNINNGNIYTKKYVERIKWPDTSVGEDDDITFHQGGKWFEPANKKPTMVYRWGMQTFHLSGGGTRPSHIALEQADENLQRINPASGIIHLNPHFKHDYYDKINTGSK